MEGSVAIALAQVAAAKATEEEGTTVMTTAATLAAAVVLVAMAVTLAAATLEAVVRRGSRNTMLETTKPHGGLHFPLATLVHRTRSRRASQPYLKAPLHPQRHQRNHLLKRLTCLALQTMMLLVAGLPLPPPVNTTGLAPPQQSTRPAASLEGMLSCDRRLGLG
jgi:hypothetical protein